MHSHLQSRWFLWGWSSCSHCSPGHASRGPDTGVFDKHSATIIILVQWSWTELSQHPRRDLNLRCTSVYSLSPNFSDKLVFWCRPAEWAFPRRYLSWSLGDDYRGRPVIWPCRHTNSECEGTIEALGRRMLREDMLVPSTTFYIVTCLKLSAGSQPARTRGLFWICLQSFKLTFWESVSCLKWLLECLFNHW